MPIAIHTLAENRVSQFAHVVGRLGVSISGSLCGTFVAAYMARADVDRFDTVGFVTSMILVGMVSFYLRIDALDRNAPSAGNTALIELLSATGTFLASIAALVSVYVIVFDETPGRMWEIMVGSWWLVGVVMQVGAGATTRLRAARRIVVR